MLVCSNQAFFIFSGDADTGAYSYSDCKSDLSRSVVCTLTVESRVKQALFTTFYTYPDKPAMLGELVNDHPTGQFEMDVRTVTHYSTEAE